MKILHLLALTAPLLLAAGRMDAQEATPAQVDQIQKIVRDYLREHPEVIISALKEYQDKQAAEQATKSREVIASHKDDLLKDPASPVGANPEGDVVLVEFFDYRCPYCKAVAPDLAKAIAADGKVRLIYKEFPILGPVSVTAARAALAAQRQDKYVAFHDKLMAFKGNLDETMIFAMASGVGLDVPKLKADMEEPEVKDAINRNYKLADKLRIQGTPAFVIGSDLLPGAASLEDLTAAIKRARAGG